MSTSFDNFIKIGQQCFWILYLLIYRKFVDYFHNSCGPSTPTPWCLRHVPLKQMPIVERKNVPKRTKSNCPIGNKRTFYEDQNVLASDPNLPHSFLPYFTASWCCLRAFALSSTSPDIYKSWLHPTFRSFWQGSYNQKGFSWLHISQNTFCSFIISLYLVPWFLL